MPSASPHTLTAVSRPGLVSVDGKTFPLRAARISAHAGRGVADTTLVQEYENPWSEPLEVLYTLPLPADGAVLGYDIRLGERTITGVIETREKARAKYTDAVLAGHAAGLLEMERADTFTLSLGNVPAHTAARVEVRVMHRLAFRPGAERALPEWEYRFPTVVGVRYHGAPGRVPDAEALDPDRADARGTPTRLDLELTLADGDAATLEPHSPNQGLTVSAIDRGCRIAFASPERLDRDVVVRWRAAGAAIGARLLEGSGLPGDNGRYGLLTLTPPAIARSVFARDLTILLDASGSMTGPPIEQAKQISGGLLRSLSPIDRFEILAFANEVTSLTRGMVAATPRSIDKALASLRGLRAGGGTEMADAVKHALEPLRSDSQRQVVLITDGHIGFENEIVGQVLRKLPAGARLHVAGVGMAPNRTLTRGASRAGRGTEVVVGTGEDAAPSVEILNQATAAPVLTEVVVRGTAVATVAPTRPSDLFAGRPVLLALELRAAGGTIEVRGNLAGQSEPWHEEITVGPRPSDEARGPALGALFGRERVEDCEMSLAAGDPEWPAPPTLDAIEKLGLRHRIATRRTSLVAISEDPTVDPQDPRRRERLAVDLPLDMSAEAVGLQVRKRSPVAHRMARADFDETTLLKSIDEDHDFHLSDKLGWTPTPARAHGRIVRYEDGVLVIEFEVPPGGFRVPHDGTRLELGAGRIVSATVVGTLGTRPGPCNEGLTVRLALRPDESLDLSAVKSVSLAGAGLSLEIDLH